MHEILQLFLRSNGFRFDALFVHALAMNVMSRKMLKE